MGEAVVVITQAVLALLVFLWCLAARRRALPRPIGGGGGGD